MKTSKIRSKNIVFCALFSTLCFISTYLVVIPLPNGYLNTGDVFVLLAGWCLGPLFGGIASAVGCALADILSSFALYAPATFIIKGAVAIFAYYTSLLFKSVLKKERYDFLIRAISALLGELLMVFGYFLFETVLYGFAGATLSLLGNALQGIVCLLCAVVLFSALYPTSFFKNTFLLSKEKKEK